MTLFFILTICHLWSFMSVDIMVLAHELYLMLQHLLVVTPGSHFLLSTLKLNKLVGQNLPNFNSNLIKSYYIFLWLIFWSFMKRKLKTGNLLHVPKIDTQGRYQRITMYFWFILFWKYLLCNTSISQAILPQTLCWW